MKNTNTTTNNTTNANAEVIVDKKEQAKKEAEAKRQAIANALALIQKEANNNIELVTSQAGHLLSSLDSVLAKIADDVKKADEKSELWSLDLTPVTFTRDGKKYQWVEVSGLDRNARVQIVDKDGKAEVLISSAKVRSMEQQAYIDALVAAGKDLTKAVALRKAVAGKTFRQVFANAQAQEKARIEKRYAKIVPPMAEQKEETEKKPVARLIKASEKASA